jgi:hypothetical protein
MVIINSLITHRMVVLPWRGSIAAVKGFITFAHRVEDKIPLILSAIF